MAQNEMRVMRGLPLRVRSMEGLGATFFEPLLQCEVHGLEPSLRAAIERTTEEWAQEDR